MSINGIVWRTYLTMAVVVVIFGFLNQWALTAVLAFTVAVSFIVGITVTIVKLKQVSTEKKSDKLSPVKKGINIWEAA
ncbi:MAG: hypothetical protein ACI85Q_002055 [Salibacteraceae bacterium]